MTKHYDRQGAETEARERSIRSKDAWIVTERLGKISKGPQWRVLSLAEYRRYNVAPCVGFYRFGQFIGGQPSF